MCNHTNLSGPCWPLQLVHNTTNPNRQSMPLSRWSTNSHGLDMCLFQQRWILPANTGITLKCGQAKGHPWDFIKTSCEYIFFNGIIEPFQFLKIILLHLTIVFSNWKPFFGVLNGQIHYVQFPTPFSHVQNHNFSIITFDSYGIDPF